MAEHSALPVRLVDGGDAQPRLVGALVQAVQGVPPELHLVDLGTVALVLAVGRHPPDRRVEQLGVDDRRVEELALAGAVAVVQRLHHRRSPTGTRCRCRRAR